MKKSKKKTKIHWLGGNQELFLTMVDPESVEWVSQAAEADLIAGVPPSFGIGNQETLTDREREILEYLVDGWSTLEIADRLHLQPRTIKYHLAGLFRKLGVTRRGEAVREGLKAGLVRL